MNEFEIGSGFGFSGQIIDELEASEYTLATIALDMSGSVGGFSDQLKAMLEEVIGACARSPYSQNLLIRVIEFSSKYKNGVNEIHGFKALSEIDINGYPDLRPGGMTPLNDGLYSGVGAANAYAQQLVDLDFAVNGITFAISDGGENASVATTTMVKDELESSVTGEIMESHYSVLIGVGSGGGGVSGILKDYQDATGIDQFIWAGDATASKLAKLAQFVSQSISSTSQALGTGGASQNISATI